MKTNINKCMVVINRINEAEKENENTINIVKSTCIKQVPHNINEKTSRDEKINKVTPISTPLYFH
jgi:hypothetical protein